MKINLDPDLVQGSPRCLRLVQAAATDRHRAKEWGIQAKFTLLTIIGSWRQPWAQWR